MTARPLAAALLLVLAHAASAQPAAPAEAGPWEPAPLDTLVTLALGEERDLGGLRVAFVDVEEDSRCPANVMCVWAGRAVVTVHVDGAPHALPLTARLPSEAEVEETGGVRVMLVALTPAPGTPLARAGAPLRATLHVRRL